MFSLESEICVQRDGSVRAVCELNGGDTVWDPIRQRDAKIQPVGQICLDIGTRKTEISHQLGLILLMVSAATMRDLKPTQSFHVSPAQIVLVEGDTDEFDTYADSWATTAGALWVDPKVSMDPECTPSLYCAVYPEEASYARVNGILVLLLPDRHYSHAMYRPFSPHFPGRHLISLS